MAKFCTHCGSEVNEDAVFCVKCGCAIENKSADMTAPKKSYISIILGIVGIVFAWIFALIGHITSIIGIVIGIKEYKKSEKSAGLVVSVIGEICSIISSVLGVILTLGI